MENSDKMISEVFTPKQWLTYYKNTWTRRAIAKTIDVQTDTVLKEKNPEEEVEHDVLQGVIITVSQRLENRKIDLQKALDILSAAKFLENLSDEDLAKRWSPEALAMAEDQLPPQPKVGDGCTLDGKPGTMQKTAQGMVCVATELPPATPADVAPKGGDENIPTGGNTPAPSAQ